MSGSCQNLLVRFCVPSRCDEVSTYATQLGVWRRGLNERVYPSYCLTADGIESVVYGSASARVSNSPGEAFAAVADAGCVVVLSEPQFFAAAMMAMTNMTAMGISRTGTEVWLCLLMSSGLRKVTIFF